MFLWVLDRPLSPPKTLLWQIIEQIQHSVSTSTPSDAVDLGRRKEIRQAVPTVVRLLLRLSNQHPAWEDLTVICVP